jgi:hypothetical protein
LKSFSATGKASKQHHSAALDFLSKDAIISQARRLGLAQGKTLVLDSMNDLTLAFDLTIHTAPKCGQQSAWSSLRLIDILRPRRARTS